MTDAEAIEVAVARTGYSPYRENLDPAAPHYDPRLWPIVRAIAAAPPPRDAPRFDGPLARRVLGCPDRSRVGCGCAGRWACARAGGAEVTYPACLDCVREEFGGSGAA